MSSPTTNPSSTTTTQTYPFQVYADPTQQLHKRLGMIRTLRLGDVRPDYMPHRSSLFVNAVRSIVQGIRSGKGATKGGDSKQVGGEFLFELGSGDADEDWKVLWCHRMKNTRDHTGMTDLRRVLGSSSADLLSGVDTSSEISSTTPPTESSSPSTPSSLPARSTAPASRKSNSRTSSSSSKLSRSVLTKLPPRNDLASANAAQGPAYSCSCSAEAGTAAPIPATPAAAATATRLARAATVSRHEGIERKKSTAARRRSWQVWR